jgi:hypothetical protein
MPVNVLSHRFIRYNQLQVSVRAVSKAGPSSRVWRLFESRHYEVPGGYKILCSRWLIYLVDLQIMITRCKRQEASVPSESSGFPPTSLRRRSSQPRVWDYWHAFTWVDITCDYKYIRYNSTANLKPITSYAWADSSTNKLYLRTIEALTVLLSGYVWNKLKSF